MMRGMKIILVVASLALFLGGCAPKKANYSGFMSDYSGLEKGPKGGADLVYKKPGVNFAKYNKLYVDKVAIYLNRDSKALGLQPDVLKNLSDAFEKELVKAVHDTYPMVPAKGLDVLRLRIAITDVESSNPALGTIGAVLPIGMAVNVVSNVATGESTSVGSASIEAEMIDSVSGEVLARIVDRKTGSTYDVATVKGKWGHTEKAFKEWAERLREWLDEVHGK